MAYLAVAARAALIMIFTVSAAGKLRDRRNYLAFVESVHAFVPPWLAALGPAATAIVAGVVTAAEAACVPLLLIPATADAGHLLAAALLAALTLAVARAVMTGRGASCRCFGATTRPLTHLHLARNVVLLLLALCGLGSSVAHPAGAVVAAAAGIAGALILINLDDLNDLLRPTARR